ncbi:MULTISPECIES: threonine synthase [unclassified Saccharopolyspora]|uniref:threonine synthase n=1 Tax=unclassified Saccharopolyspora TaxID=2646250 RepID=UPI001CD29128|nr:MULTISPECIES: threonine synthase [unclassified Saccharopolyspora]MCA1184972.1 threonine synthase [Saccharopolyspora sp. 6T]MCA1190694.1 threonine synthase [Saccharopolyspora sp. 6V]MCA1278158.1 threonine synthase [Saccharopolyspora sp. 7B]
MGDEPHLVDRSGRRYRIDEPRWRGDDGSPLLVAPLPGIGREQVDTGVGSQWRYAAALAQPHLAPVSLGEGRTPLLPRRFAGLDVAVKVEASNPTASFKDRGVSVLISTVRAQGVRAVLADSSGNGGSSVAAYCAAAGIDARILAPDSTSPDKVLQSRVHGATVDLVPGGRQRTADEAVRRSARRCYAGHNWHPAFLDGIKLIAYEIWEDLGFRAPTAVVVPAGAGSLVLGCAAGFAELRRAGQIDRVPRLLVAQPERCSPLVRAFAAGADHVEDADWPGTIAEGTAIARPVRDREVLRALRDSGGAATAVPERELRPATLELAGTGLYAEPTSAQVVPAIARFARDGLLGPDDTVVAVLTGSGLKASAAMARLLDE